MSKVKLGIIGYGNIGSQHGKSIKSGKTPMVELVAVADCRPERLQLAKYFWRKIICIFDS